MELELPLARFVVELSHVIRSDQNIDGVWGKTFRLETAVIDNSKNAAKSIFIPDNQSQGFGEGKYYQAITINYENE